MQRVLWEAQARESERRGGYERDHDSRRDDAGLIVHRTVDGARTGCQYERERAVSRDKDGIAGMRGGNV